MHGLEITRLGSKKYKKELKVLTKQYLYPIKLYQLVIIQKQSKIIS